MKVMRRMLLLLLATIMCLQQITGFVVNAQDVSPKVEQIEEDVENREKEINKKAEDVTYVKNSSTPDYDIWMADTMLLGINNQGNGIYPMFQSFQEPVYSELGGYLVDDVPLVALSTTWSVLLNSEYRNQFANEPKYIYEVLLMDYLKYEADRKETSIDLENSDFKIAKELYDRLVQGMDDNAFEAIKEMSVEDAISYYDRIGVLENINISIEELTAGAKSVKDLIDMLSDYSALQQVKEERISLLKSARDTCASSSNPNNDFIKAADELISILEGSFFQYVQGKSLDYLWNEGLDYAWEKLCDANPVLKSIEFGVTGLDVLFDSTNKSSNNLKLVLLYTLDCYMKQGMMAATSKYMDDKTKTNGQNFIACFKGYAQFQMFGNDYAKTWLEGYLDSGALADIVNNIFYRENIKTARELIERSDSQAENRKTILELIDKYADIYHDMYKNSEFEEFIFDGNTSSNSQIYNGKCGDNAYWILFEDGTLHIYGDGDMYDWNYYASNPTPWFLYSDKILKVIIIDGIKSIGMEAFRWCKNLTSITIPGTVTSIRDWAFSDCSKLKNITIPNSMTSIGSMAFYYCYSLTSITIPSSVTSIENDSFVCCFSLISINVDSNNKYYSSLKGTLFNKDQSIIIKVPEMQKQFVIPNSVVGIGDRAFEDCIYLTSITIPNSVTSIGDWAFYSCDNLTSITIPNSVTSIGYLAFAFCDSMTNITISYNVKSIGNRAFYYCESLTSISVSSNNEYFSSYDGALFNKDKTTLIMVPEVKEQFVIPKSVINIGDYAFSNCENITSVTIPNSVTSIGEWAFSYCENLTSITLPNSLVNIGNRAFYYCESLTSIMIPKNVKNIGEEVLRSCLSLTSINVDSNNKYYSSYDGALFNKDKTKLIKVPEEKEQFIIPNSVTSIENYALEWCSELTSISIPNSVTSIGIGAFKYSYNLISITFPESVTSIEEETFLGCDSLKSVTIPNSVTSIGASAFAWCDSLTSVTIPNSVTKIGNDAFWCCDNLTLNVYPNSYALQYAKENNISYKIIGPAKSIKLNKTSLKLSKGNSTKLSAAISPSNVTDKTLKWSSSNSKIAKVDSKGKVTAVNYGKATITVKTSNGKTAKCTVTVPYKITYKLNGGKNSKSNPSSYYGKKITLKNPTRKGYTFKGWYSDSKYKKKVTSFSSGNKTLYAKWSKVSVSKAKTPTLSNVKGKKLKITYSATSGAKGYQIQYSTSKKFSKPITKTITGRSATYTLSKGKTYYVRVRAYKKDSTGSKVYGSWSSIKSKKITK